MKKLVIFFALFHIAFLLNAQTPQNDESEIIIQVNHTLSVVVVPAYLALSVNGKQVASEQSGYVHRAIVKNGTVSILLIARHNRQTLASRTLTFNANHETVTVEASVISSASTRSGENRQANIQTMRVVRSTPLPVNESEGIDQTVADSYERLINNIPQNSVVAVVNISSRDISYAEYFIDEITYLLVNSKRCRVVERNRLDAIRAEQNFQMSGDVDDDQVISIGKMSGANVVITGTITGSGQMRRLRLKALDVRTGEIIAMSSEQF